MFLATLVISAALSNPVQVEGTWCHPNRLIIRTELAQKEGLTVQSEFPEIGFSVIETGNRGLNPEFQRLQKSYGQDSVFLDRAAFPAYSPNDPLMSNSWHHPTIKSNQVWDSTLGNPITVAVIDTGVNVAHEDLAGNIWVNAGEIPNNGVDDDQNGYVDDVNGYDFSYNDGNPNDVNGHGTACSGIIAAVMDNQKGGAGVAPYAKIMALKASNDAGYFYDSQNIAAYLYATANGAKILSCSFFSDRVSEPERLALEFAHANGVLPIVAAGNDRTVIPYYPAAHDVCVAVAALSTNLARAGFSNYGRWVDLAAPGVGIVTTTGGGDYSTGFSGTSAACPVVAGAAALLWGEYPTASVSMIRRVMQQTAIPTVAANIGQYTNYGQVDALAAYNALSTGSWTPPPVQSRAVSPLPLAGYLRSRTAIRMRFDGRLLGGSGIQAFQSGQPLRKVGQSADYVEFGPRSAGSNIEIRNGATVLQTVAVPNLPGSVLYPLSEASSRSGDYNGSFETSLALDGVSGRTVINGDGDSTLELVFRGVSRVRPLTFQIRRNWNSAIGNELIRIYDWKSNSYPYGSFVQLSSMGAASLNGFTTTTVSVPNPSRMADVDGAVYVQVVLTGGTPGSVYNLDFAGLIEP